MQAHPPALSLPAETGVCGWAGEEALLLPSHSGSWGMGPFPAPRSLPQGSRDSVSLLSPPTRCRTDSHLPSLSRPRSRSPPAALLLALTGVNHRIAGKG